MDSRALTKIQSIILIFVIVVAGVASAFYLFFIDYSQSKNTIRIGVLGDLDMHMGKSVFEGVLLAAEQINAEGGILGREIEVFSEDSDWESHAQDNVVAIHALNKLLNVYNVDYVITSDGLPLMFSYQDTVSDHKKILFGVAATSDEYTQRVLDDYPKYKYFFRTFPNETHAILGFCDSLVSLREYSGFNKIAFLADEIFAHSSPLFANFISQGYGFEVVYQNTFASGTVDFSSYLSAVEEAEAEILHPWIGSKEGIFLVKEWYDRKSPFVLWGYNGLVGDAKGWELTDGKCEYTTFGGFAVTAGYPLTNQTLPMRDAYFERWDKYPIHVAAAAYDTLRFILFNALERAQTTDTDTVISALEQTSIETALARDFVFTKSHDVMGSTNINNPDEDYMVGMMFQWQNKKQVPMTPMKIKDEVGATYVFPDWAGPWDE